MLEFSDIGLVLTGGVFLIGFMLSGTLADYKESEKIPAELACSFETLEEAFAQAAVAKSTVDLNSERRGLLEAGEEIWRWFHRTRTQDDVIAALHKLRDRLLALESVGASPHASRSLRELHNLRRYVTRVAVISRTGFIAAGYALLEVLTGAVLTMMLASHFKNRLTECVLVCFVTLIFVYMVRLIRDIDDPFEYSESGPTGAVEVEGLFPLREIPRPPQRPNRVATRLGLESGAR